MELQSDDPDFSVSWLLGLRPHRTFGRCPHWAKQFETDDPDFFVSWLLGLRHGGEGSSSGTQFTCPPWLKEFESTDPDFLVSRILGLIPGLPVFTEQAADADAQLEPQGAAEAETSESEEDDDDAEYGLRRLFGDLTEEELAAEASEKTETTEEQPEEAPVLAEPSFLELCEKMEDLLLEIEESASDDDSDTESLDGLSPEDTKDESPSRIEWLRQKDIEKAENKYLDRLMSLPGLEETKTMFLHAKAKVQAATRRETSLKKENFDVVFTGNEGTGKTVMAHLYAKFLQSLGLVKPAGGYNPIHVVSSYYFGKTSTLDSMRNICASCNGCIVILDDAHLIDRNDDANLWSFVTRAKELSGNIVLILAGDAEAGLSNQLAYSAEVLNHFRNIKLPNYTDDQLRVVFHGMVRKWFNKKMKLDGEVDDAFVKILTRRLLRGTNEKTFANIWPLKKAFVMASRRQVERFRQARREGLYLEDYFMTKEDLLGESPSLKPESSPAWKELQSLVGLDSVKESIVLVVNQVNQNYERELRGLEPLQVTANRVFLGSPGTGKTTVAKLYARILADFGILSKGEVVMKNPTDLIDRYVGGSENNTREALAEADGSVLIIDDAHMLDPGKRSGSGSKTGDFRGAILDTLVAEVSGAPGEDRCVILCGYSDQMKEMFSNANPGLARRFPLDTAFVFEDFDAGTLEKVLDLKLGKEKLEATEKAREVAMDILKRASVRPNFGNGAEVDNLISKAVLARTRRIAKLEEAERNNADNIPFEPEDFDADWDRHTRAVANTRALFDGFIGYEEIITKFESYQYMAQGMRLRGIDPRPYIPFTYVFKGPPGTGKTSTARKLGQIFYDMGLLSGADVIEVSASQLIGEYCGQTGPKTVRLLESALGKVLFIDEAYRLAIPGSFAEEAVSELVDAVTKPKFARKLIIVLAGYEEDMDRLMRANHGMRSRFATEFTFKPLRAEQCIEQLRSIVGKVGITIQNTMEMESSTRNTLVGSLSSMSRDKGWASGRSIETLGEKLIAHIFKECAKNGYTGKDLVVSGKDLVTILASSGIAAPGAMRGVPGQMGPRQLMTLRDLEGYE